MGSQANAENKIWPWIAAVLATVLTGIGLAGYSAARSDITSFERHLGNIGERTSVLEQANKDWTRRLGHIEEQLDRLLSRNAVHGP